MASSANILPELRQRADEADQIISQLKIQLQQLENSDNSAPGTTESDIRNLAKENDVLRKEVEQLKQELVAAEARHGIRQIPLPNRTSPVNETTAAVAAVTPNTVTKATSSGSEVKGFCTTTAEKTTNAACNKPRNAPKPDKKSDNKPAATATGSETVDVSRLNMRIGKILEVKKHPDADSLYVEKVDVGENNFRTIVSGLVKHVPIEQMENRFAVFLINLKPAKMRGILSEGMIMCASSPEKVEIIVPPSSAAIGDRVIVDGYPGTPEELLNPKKKIWEQIQPDLRINADGVATYKGALWKLERKEGVFNVPSMTNSGIK